MNNIKKYEMINTKVKKILKFFNLFLVVFLLNGCSKPILKNYNPNNYSKNRVIWSGFLYSEDGGKQWEMKNKIGEKSIANLDIFSIIITSQNYPQSLFIGTKNHGIFKSDDLGYNWEHLKSFLFNDVYALAVDEFVTGDVLNTYLYASGTENKRGKILKSEDLGKSWNEIYTEPDENIKVLSLAVDSKGWIYAGDTKGSFFRSKNKGETWENIYNAQAPILDIKIDNKDNNLIYLLLWKKTALYTLNGGKTFNKFNQSQSKLKNIRRENRGEKLNIGKAYSLAIDNQHKGIVYLGTDKGLFKSQDDGKTLEKVNTLTSSNNYPIRTLAINPIDSRKIIYAAAKTIYKSEDSGQTWSTFQLNTNKIVSKILFNQENPDIIFAGMKKANN